MREYATLSPRARHLFLSALSQFVRYVDTGALPPALRVKRIQGTDRLWEVTWDKDGRAVFEYGEPVPGKGRHIIWRRIGTHGIFRDLPGSSGILEE